MQRFFSAFPDGCPGLGLLLLRIVTALTAIGHGVVRLREAGVAPIDAGSAVVAMVSGSAVLVGLFTPGSAVILAATLAWFWFPVHAETLLAGTRGALLTIADAVAIALLGPGAFSIDARLFGRREIVIWHQPRP